MVKKTIIPGRAIGDSATTKHIERALRSEPSVVEKNLSTRHLERALSQNNTPSTGGDAAPKDGDSKK